MRDPTACTEEGCAVEAGTGSRLDTSLLLAGPKVDFLLPQRPAYRDNRSSRGATVWVVILPESEIPVLQGGPGPGPNTP